MLFVIFIFLMLFLTYFSSLSDATLRITLGGQRDKDFSIDSIYNKDDAKPIFIMLVGCLAKHFQGLSPI
jgi:hypothetical protein